MKLSFRPSLTRLALGAIASNLLLTIAGGAAAATGTAAVCTGWPLCLPTNRYGWYQVLHIVLAGVAGLLILWLLIKAWKEQRGHLVLLPLATVTAILYFGQALVGAVQVARLYPLHLVILHAASAVSVWISLFMLVLVAARTADAQGAKKPEGEPRRLRDFLMLGKPWIVALLLVTTFGGLVAGGRAWPAAGVAFWTLFGGALAAMGSSALNQFIDRDVDRRMQRTAKRPLPAGRLTPAEGLSYGLALCLVSYYLLACFVNLTAALLALAGIFYYVIFYSVLLKRATVQNIVIGGGAGAIPPMVGWAAAAGHLSLGAWILFLIIFMWTPPHFWALAIVRSKDYAKAGIPMLPTVKGEGAARTQILLYTILLVGTTLLMPVVGAAGPIYLVLAIILGAGLLISAWRVWRIPGNKVAWSMYRWSSFYLLFIFAALIADSVARLG